MSTIDPLYPFWESQYLDPRDERRRIWVDDEDGDGHHECPDDDDEQDDDK